MTPESRRDRAAILRRGGVAPASSEFGRVLPVILYTGYLVSFRELRFSAGLKRKILWPEVRG